MQMSPRESPDTSNESESGSPTLPTRTDGGTDLPLPPRPAEVLPPQRSPHHKATMAVLMREQSMTFSGPLPPPALLAQYEQIAPGAAQQIIAMAEREQAFSHKITEKALDTEGAET